MTHRTLRQQFTGLGLLLIMLCLLGIGYIHLRNTGSAREPTTVPSLTAIRFSTESTHLEALLKQQGIKAAFSYASDNIAKDPSFAKSCHPLLHELGNVAYTYFGDYATAIQYQNELCNSGYTHGVVEAYFLKAPDVAQAMTQACGAKEEQSFAKWQCFHGIGHGVMLTNNKQLAPSIRLCETLTSNFSTEACVNGIFMEHFIVQSHGGDLPTTNPTSLRDCMDQKTTYRKTCYLYASTAYLAFHSGRYGDAIQWCGGADKNDVTTCVLGVGSAAMKDNITNPSNVQQICLQAPKAYQAYCASGAVSMYTHYTASASAATSLCKKEFSRYRAICEATVTDRMKELHIQ
ncbi:MAG TPA: hypothetical protein VLH38_00090 [Patescibacteria group bacterium]|nr:hypothetical protein [Patescibacteria group bacterium]